MIRVVLQTLTCYSACWAACTSGAALDAAGGCATLGAAGGCGCPQNGAQGAAAGGCDRPQNDAEGAAAGTRSCVEAAAALPEEEAALE